MKHLFKASLLVFGLLLSSCLCNKAVYYSDGRWEVPYFDASYYRHYPYLHHPNPFTQYNRIFIPIEDEQSWRLSKDYQISLDSAVKIIGLINSSDVEKDLQILSLNKEDVAPLTDLRMPSSESIQRVASVLNENPEAIQMMFQDFIASAQTR